METNKTKWKWNSISLNTINLVEHLCVCVSLLILQSFRFHLEITQWLCILYFCHSKLILFDVLCRIVEVLFAQNWMEKMREREKEFVLQYRSHWKVCIYSAVNLIFILRTIFSQLDEFFIYCSIFIRHRSRRRSRRHSIFFLHIHSFFHPQTKRIESYRCQKIHLWFFSIREWFVFKWFGFRIFCAMLLFSDIWTHACSRSVKSMKWFIYLEQRIKEKVETKTVEKANEKVKMREKDDEIAI